MRKDTIDIVLRKKIKGSSFRVYAAKHFVFNLNEAFLSGSVRIMSGSTPWAISSSRMTSASGAGSLLPWAPQVTIRQGDSFQASAAASMRHCSCREGSPSGLTCAPRTMIAS